MNPTPIVLNDLYDNDLRVRKVIWLLGNVAAATDELTEAIDEEESICQLLGLSDDKVGEMNGDPEEVATFISESKKLGFLVQAETPFPHFTKGRRAYSAGWGHTCTKWFYVEALDADLIKQMIAWKQEIHTEEKAKADGL